MNAQYDRAHIDAWICKAATNVIVSMAIFYYQTADRVQVRNNFWQGEISEQLV